MSNLGDSFKELNVGGIRTFVLHEWEIGQDPIPEYEDEGAVGYCYHWVEDACAMLGQGDRCLSLTCGYYYPYRRRLTAKTLQQAVASVLEKHGIACHLAGESPQVYDHRRRSDRSISVNCTYEDRCFLFWAMDEHEREWVREDLGDYTAFLSDDELETDME